MNKIQMYPEVQSLRLIDFKHTRAALKKISATH